MPDGSLPADRVPAFQPFHREMVRAARDGGGAWVKGEVLAALLRAASVPMPPAAAPEGFPRLRNVLLEGRASTFLSPAEAERILARLPAPDAPSPFTVVTPVRVEDLRSRLMALHREACAGAEAAGADEAQRRAFDRLAIGLLDAAAMLPAQPDAEVSARAARLFRAEAQS